MKMRMIRDKTKAAKWREQNLQMRNLRKKVKSGFNYAKGSKAQKFTKAQKAVQYTQNIKVDFSISNGRG